MIPEERFLWIKTRFDNAVVDTVIEFLRCPRQFHGDTGISHYLYHCVHGQLGNDLFSTSDTYVPHIRP